MQRMKATLEQVRGQCAVDNRKRDAQLQKLKSHLSGVQRGKRDVFGTSSIIITPTSSFASTAGLDGGGEGLDSPGYTLGQETTDFLTNLCQNLSDEVCTFRVIPDPSYGLRAPSGATSSC